MAIIDRIEEDFRQALKKRDEITVSTLRMLKSAVHNKEIEKKGEKLKDAEVVRIVARQLEQRRDSIEQFKKGNRPELAEKEAREMEVLKKYMPQQLSEDEIVNIVKRIIAETKAKDRSDLGKVMKLAMAELQGRAEGKLVNQIVLTQLKS